LGPGRKEHETRAFSKSFVIWLNKFFKTGYWQVILAFGFKSPYVESSPGDPITAYARNESSNKVCFIGIHFHIQVQGTKIGCRDLRQSLRRKIWTEFTVKFIKVGFEIISCFSYKPTSLWHNSWSINTSKKLKSQMLHWNTFFNKSFFFQVLQSMYHKACIRNLRAANYRKGLRPRDDYDPGTEATASWVGSFSCQLHI
jgi:hypothetical protein